MNFTVILFEVCFFLNLLIISFSWFKIILFQAPFCIPHVPPCSVPYSSYHGSVPSSLPLTNFQMLPAPSQTSLLPASTQTSFFPSHTQTSLLPASTQTSLHPAPYQTNQTNPLPAPYQTNLLLSHTQTRLLSAPYQTNLPPAPYQTNQTNPLPVPHQTNLFQQIRNEDCLNQGRVSKWKKKIWPENFSQIGKNNSFEALNALKDLEKTLIQNMNL